MAAGDYQSFAQFANDLLEGVHDLETDTIKCAIVDNTIVPTATTPDPRWGAGGTTNLSANEVSGTGYTAGGIDIAATVSLTTTTATFTGGTNPSWSQDASGFTNGYWGIIYNDTAAGKQAIGYLELGGPVSLQSGDVTLTVPSGGITTITV